MPDNNELNVPKSFGHTGWLPDIPDSRDFEYRQVFKAMKRPPSFVDLSPELSPIEDQETLGACVLHAIAGSAEHLWRREGITLDASRLAPYRSARALRGWVDTDTGCFIRDAIKVVAKEGVGDERLWPYHTKRFRDMPTQEYFDDAEKHRISSYYRLHGVVDMIDALARGFTVPFGVPLYESFEPDHQGIIPMPKPKEREMGGHAMLAVGYDLPRKLIKVRNSWGVSWGVGGHCWIPLDYMDQADDLWVFEVIS